MAEFTDTEQKRLRETVEGILNGKKMKEHRVVKHKWNFEPPNTSEITSLEHKLAALQERFDAAKQVDLTEAITQKGLNMGRDNHWNRNER